jgi:hypothetical protein
VVRRLDLKLFQLGPEQRLSRAKDDWFSGLAGAILVC